MGVLTVDATEEDKMQSKHRSLWSAKSDSLVNGGINFVGILLPLASSTRASAPVTLKGLVLKQTEFSTAVPVSGAKRDCASGSPKSCLLAWE